MKLSSLRSKYQKKRSLRPISQKLQLKILGTNDVKEKKLKLILKAKIIFCFLVVILFSWQSILAQPNYPTQYSSETIKQSDTNDFDKTLSPYFMVPDGETDKEHFPLKSTKAEVKIVGVIASVKVSQVYQNRGNKPMEATYIFPGSTQAAVNNLKMKVGERIIVAQIQEKELAKRNYEVAKSEGKKASLLEQHRPNVFQMNVANIMPNDQVEVELEYTEYLLPTNGEYSFVYPTVVGPRYSNESSNQNSTNNWVSNPYLAEGNDIPYTFDLSLEINSSIPLKDVASSSHQISIDYQNPNEATVKVSEDNKTTGNRDFILKYRLKDRQINSGALLYQGESVGSDSEKLEDGNKNPALEKSPESTPETSGETVTKDSENFFLVMLEPPLRPTVEQIPPREYIFVVDVSGSMYGFPLDTSKQLMKELLGTLRPEDKFNVILFAGGFSKLSEQSIPAIPENIQKATFLIDTFQGGGGTELLPALEAALKMGDAEGVSKSIVVVTDGYISFEKNSFELIKKNLGNANLFAFGIGTAVNRYLIEGMARVGLGEAFIVTNPREAKEISNKFKKYISSPVLTDIKVEYQGFQAYDVEPYTVPDLFAERPLNIFGKWKGEKSGKIVISGIAGKEKFAKEIDLKDLNAEKSNEALKYLWARKKIATISDYNSLSLTEENRNQITSLGLKYNLLTQYTSFLAVDEVVSNPSRNLTTVKQPNPLPQGVSNQAVGGGFAELLGSSPEPEFYLMAVLSLIMIFVSTRKIFQNSN